MQMGKYIDALSAIPLFSCFSKDEIRSLFNSAQYNLRKYGKGQILYLHNEVCQNLDIILHGELTVQKIDAAGSVLTVSVFAETENIGANLLFASRNTYPFTVLASSDAVILHLNKGFILSLCQKSIPFTSRLLTAISDRTFLLTEKINEISFKTIRQSVLDILKYEYRLRKTPVISLPFTKKELAERLGVQRTSLSRELQKMRNAGLITYNSSTITINNPEIM